ncbi:hypothetical protein [Pseudomonas sp. ICMP 561]|uniref:hypothetical protein n=1 Tax=Pseudomonas sp. ICMP 561 TaxID=1718918 RepID=UPI000C089A22|nr:hypothetical protein [Pseudomonas sp. ICMP 561]PHN27125.1 hypothetical protein AO242_02145 [Pseudomonas sp. ICMP 561]
MSIDKTTQLISTRSEINANLLLRAGWTLLLVADRQEGEHQWLLYQFGWQQEHDPVEVTFTGIEGGPDPF